MAVEPLDLGDDEELRLRIERSVEDPDRLLRGITGRIETYRLMNAAASLSPDRAALERVVAAAGELKAALVRLNGVTEGEAVRALRFDYHTGVLLPGDPHAILASARHGALRLSRDLSRWLEATKLSRGRRPDGARRIMVQDIASLCEHHGLRLDARTHYSTFLRLLEVALQAAGIIPKGDIPDIAKIAAEALSKRQSARKNN